MNSLNNASVIRDALIEGGRIKRPAKTDGEGAQGMRDALVTGQKISPFSTGGLRRPGKEDIKNFFDEIGEAEYLSMMPLIPGVPFEAIYVQGSLISGKVNGKDHILKYLKSIGHLPSEINAHRPIKVSGVISLCLENLYEWLTEGTLTDLVSYVSKVAEKETNLYRTVAYTYSVASPDGSMLTDLEELTINGFMVPPNRAVKSADISAKLREKDLTLPNTGRAIRPMISSLGPLDASHELIVPADYTMTHETVKKTIPTYDHHGRLVLRVMTDKSSHYVPLSMATALGVVRGSKVTFSHDIKRSGKRHSCLVDCDAEEEAEYKCPTCKSHIMPFNSRYQCSNSDCPTRCMERLVYSLPRPLINRILPLNLQTKKAFRKAVTPLDFVCDMKDEFFKGNDALVDDILAHLKTLSADHLLRAYISRPTPGKFEELVLTHKVPMTSRKLIAQIDKLIFLDARR